MEEVYIAICEDDNYDSTRLQKYILEYADSTSCNIVIDVYCSGEEFLSSEADKYSLVFLDIYMDKLTGIEVAKILFSRNRRMRFVFCSSTIDYAAESYDVSALGYLVKPVDKEKLFKVLDKYFDAIKKMKKINIKVGRMEEEIYVDDILYIEALNKKSLVHTVNGNIEASQPFSYFCKELSASDFVKPIRYALVSVSKICGIPKDILKLSDGTQIPISRLERKKIHDVVMDYRWKMSFINMDV